QHSAIHSDHACKGIHMPAQLVINVRAGTAQLVQDLEQGGGAVKKFAHNAGGDIRIVGSEFRILELQAQGSIRAAEQFFSKILGGGKLGAAVFPAFGAIAFGEVLVNIGTKGFDAFKKIQDQAERARDAFAKFAQPLKTTNDELELANARLQKDILKLQGRTEN